MNRRTTWHPPARPEWVRRINEEGRCMDIRAVVPLDESSLLDAATRNTGLSDFGDDAWREPFRVFLRSLEDDAELNLMGRLMTRSDILVFLEARLRIEDTYRRHPEIEDERIQSPLFIVGVPRTGTSILHQLLTQIPGNGAVRCWEALFPCPPPESSTYDSDPRIEKADRLLRQNFRVTPTYENAYEMGGNLPTECIHFMSLSFISAYWLSSLGQVTGYLQWCYARGGPLWTQAYQYHCRVLKLLQWKNPRAQWVLKSPGHLDMLPSLFEVYPDARVVWTHRDPVKAYASGVDLLGLLQWVRSDHPLKGGAENLMSIEGTAAALCRPIDWMEQGLVPKAQVFNAIFRDFTDDPVSMVARIYDHFGMTLSDEARGRMQRYMDAHPREKRRHVYSTEAADLVSHERQVLRRYQETFGVPNEV